MHAHADLTFETRTLHGQSNNVNLAPDGGNELEETIQIVGADLVVDAGTSRTETNFASNLQYFRYADNTFDDELVGGAMLLFSADIVPERLRWRVTDNYGQQVIDTLQTITPLNRQDTNVFRTGPDLNLPMSERTALSLQARRSVLSFEESPTDSTRNTGQIGITRQNTAVWATTLGYLAEDTAFDDLEGVDFGRRSAFVTAVATGRRTTLSVTLGNDRIQNLSGGASGDRYNISFNRQFGPVGAFTFTVGRSFSDNGDIFRFGQSNIDVRQTQDVVATPDPFESTFGLVGYTVAGPLTDWAALGFWRDSDYLTEDQFDREEHGLRFFVRRTFRSRWEGSVQGVSVRRNLSGFRQRDDTHVWGLEVMRRFGQKFGVGVRTEYVLRRQHPSIVDRQENRVFVFLDYALRRTELLRERALDSI